MPSDHCIIDKETGKFTCEHCGAMEGYDLPAPIDTFVKAINAFLDKHQNCTIADGPVQKAIFTGSSDDNVYVEGIRGGDEFSCYRQDEGYVHARFTIGGKMRIYAIYDGCWSFAVGQVDESIPLPDWPVRHKGSKGYTSILEIEVPAGVTLHREGK
jgi:hypothetical protein